MYLAIIQHLNYSGQETLKKFKKNFFFCLFTVYVSDTLVRLKHYQGQEICFQLVDLKQSYNHAKCERPLLNSILKNRKSQH